MTGAIDSSFFDFRELFITVNNDKTDPQKNDVVRMLSLMHYTRYSAVLAALVEHRTEVLKSNEPEKSWSDVKALSTRQMRKVATEEIQKEIAGYSGSLTTRDFAIFQNKRRRDLLRDALAEKNIELKKSSTLASRYIAGIIGLSLKEVVRRYCISYERNQETEYRDAVSKVIEENRSKIDAETSDLKKRKIKQQLARQIWHSRSPTSTTPTSTPTSTPK
jgi:hypothetical protein